MAEDEAFRTKFIDPDFRRDPKTSVFCCRCQKDIKGTPEFYVHLIDGCAVLHPEDEHLLPSDYPQDYGIRPVGADCAKFIGKEWVTAGVRADGKQRE